MNSSSEPTSNGAAPAPLPQPTRERWQPLRSGLVNLYRYDYEEFHFEQGRLLVRGDNGTGKSRILALQMPFLLDGEVSPARVEPDGDPAKRIEWNLLLGRLDDRTGYTWIEFGRRAPDGSPAFVTLGCGMRAVAGQPGLRARWFFITPRRIGEDLFLQTSKGHPLGRDKLAEAIGGQGRVFQGAEEYRRAVDETLFGLGERYGRLIDLLIRLRRPQLSRRLDEEELSRTLSDALPVLPASLLEIVAEAFRSLQADQDALRGFGLVRSAADDFLREYRIYARIAARRRAKGVRTAHSAYEEAQRKLREAEGRLAEAGERLGRLVEKEAEIDRDLAGADEEGRTLRASPEMRTAEEIEQAQKGADAAAGSLRQAVDDESAAVRAAEEARGRLVAVEKEVTEVEMGADRTLRAAEAHAAEADLMDRHREHLPAGPVSGWPADWPAAPAEESLDRALHERRKAVSHLRRRESEATAARSAWEEAERERKRADEDCSAAREQEAAAREQFEAVSAVLFAGYRTWHAGLRVLTPATAEELEEVYSAWLERRAGENPLREAAQAAHRAAVERIAAQQERVRRLRAEAEEILAGLRGEVEALKAGATQPPPAPPTRRADRTGRPGAPLWRLCDFRPDVSDADRAGIEAALEASGLLDAWVTPDGRLLAAGTEDTFLSVADLRQVQPSRHAGEWLVPAIDPAGGLAEDTVAAILRRVGRGPEEGDHWIDAGGSWRMGPVTGRWTKPAPEFIGEGTRAAARRRRIEELGVEIREREAACARLEGEREALAGRLAEADAEWKSTPDGQPLFQAGFAWDAAARAVTDSFAAHETAEKAAAQKRAAHEEAERRWAEDARDLGLAAWRQRLGELETALSNYGSALARVWPTLRHWASENRRLADGRRHLAAAIEERERRCARRRQAEDAAAAAEGRFRTLKETHGASVEAVLARLRTVDERIDRLKRSRKEAAEDRLQQTSARVAAEGDRMRAAEDRGRHETERAAAAANLQRFAEHRLLAEADGGLAGIEPVGWTMTRAVEIAREIESRLSDTPDDDEAWRRRQDAIHGHVQELRDRLVAQGHQPETHQLDELVLVRCIFQGRPLTMTELRDAFAAEVAERERLLAAREREIIENHLLGEVAVELQRLIRAAEEWVASANGELAARPTSTGMRFRFAWTPLDDGGFPSVRRAFLRTSELWAPAERGALAQFLQGRIRAAQAADENGSWRDHLAAALDYREWHRFAVERHQDGQWRRLDRRVYGTGSGGEKALALTLPRFAAAAAHYRGAAAHAPRLVVLDEAFAGIDPNMRAQCLGVLAQFDLDVMMTSENEWGCYPTVPGLAIYHLTAFPGLDAIGATRWVWNGRERRRQDAAIPPDRPAVPPNEGESASLPADELPAADPDDQEPSRRDA